VLSAIQWILFGTGSAATVAVVAGVRRHRPARIRPWALLGASVLSSAVGDLFYALGRWSAADLCYTVQFVLVTLCLFQLTRGSAVLVDRARLIDLVAFACSALLVVWVFVLGDRGTFGDISATFVLGALLLVGVAGRLIAATWHNWSAILLGVGALGVLVSDIVYPIWPGPLGNLGYFVLYLSWAAAALHPSMVELTAPGQPQPTVWRGRWAALLSVSVATPPAVLLIESVTGGVTDGVVIAAASGLTLALTFTRLADSLRQHSAALVRERGLREASAALVAAADLSAVDGAVRSAVRHLLPRGIHKVVFAPDDGRLTLEALPPAESGPSPRSWWVSPSTAPAGAGTLVCPLWLEPLAVARPNGGALVLTGDRGLIEAARDTLEVLAGQAALALDRISLVEAVGRRDSDLYLRAVIRNTADAMLVIDSDQRIRYASPALRQLIGVEELPPLATLHDLVSPDDRSPVRQALQNDGDGVVFCALRRPDDTQVLVEVTYRDLREDRLVQGFVVTMRNVTEAREPGEQLPQLHNQDELPAWINRRSAQHKFRY
jgi:PAS domain S-box-containing protein